MTPATLVSHRPLAEQAQQVLRAMVERGGLTQAEAYDLRPRCTRLAARVKDLREAYGDSAVEGVWETDGRSRWVRYKWVGELAQQTSLGL